MWLIREIVVAGLPPLVVQAIKLKCGLWNIVNFKRLISYSLFLLFSNFLTNIIVVILPVPPFTPSCSWFRHKIDQIRCKKIQGGFFAMGDIKFRRAIIQLFPPATQKIS